MIAAALLALAAPTAADYRADALALDREIARQYAYLDRFPGGVLPDSAALAAERDDVHDADSLLRYAEHRLLFLADHHAITAKSFPDDWALVPSYADLWIVRAPDGGFLVDSSRADGPALAAGIVAGDRLLAVNGVPIEQAVAAFWAPIGRPPVADADAFAARILAAGRRDRARVLTVAGAGGERTLTLPSLYAAPNEDRPSLSCLVAASAGARARVVVRFNNSLGDAATVAAFDRCMTSAPSAAPGTLDLTDTPSGGDTSVARGIMGWFTTRAIGYQIHKLPAEERETGIARQWVEQVLPRAAKYHRGPVEVRVGRWTGSMGEGLAVGMDALGARVCGTRMAGLRGAVYDVTLPATGLTVKLPAERVSTVIGVSREAYVPSPRCEAP